MTKKEIAFISTQFHDNEEKESKQQYENTTWKIVKLWSQLRGGERGTEQEVRGVTNDIHGKLTCRQAFFLSRQEKESLNAGRTWTVVTRQTSNDWSLVRFPSKTSVYSELSHLEIWKDQAFFNNKSIFKLTGESMSGSRGCCQRLSPVTELK